MRSVLIIAALLVQSSALAADLTVPNQSVTPGAVRMLSLRTICKTKWGTDRRFVTVGMRRQAFANYGLSGNDDKACKPDKHGRRCELDHSIPRQLGGADDIRNLWPMPFGTKPWNAVRKDQVEMRLHKEVCAKRISLKQAQKEISRDYRVAYRRYFGEPK